MAINGQNQTKTQGLRSEKPIFVWTADEFADYQKNSGWFAIVVVIALVLIAFFVWQKNWTATAVIGAASLALIIQSRTKPKKVKCQIFADGIVVNERPFGFESFKSFWMVVSGDHIQVRFQPQGRFGAPVSMPIEQEDPEQIRLYLAKHLPEDEDKGEDFTDVIQRWFRF